MPPSRAQRVDRALHRRLSKHGLQSFANGGKNHAGRSGARARSRSALADFSENFRGGITGYDRNGNHSSPGGFDFLSSDDLIAGPVAAFYQHIGKQPRDDFTRREVVENQNGINAFQRGDNFRAFPLGQNGPPLAFQLPYTGIAVETDDQRLAKLARLFQAAHVARMQQVEAPVRENNAPPVAFFAAKPQNRFL